MNYFSGVLGDASSNLKITIKNNKMCIIPTRDESNMISNNDINNESETLNISMLTEMDIFVLNPPDPDPHPMVFAYGTDELSGELSIEIPPLFTDTMDFIYDAPSGNIGSMCAIECDWGDEGGGDDNEVLEEVPEVYFVGSSCEESMR